MQGYRPNLTIDQFTELQVDERLEALRDELRDWNWLIFLGIMTHFIACYLFLIAWY